MTTFRGSKDTELEKEKPIKQKKKHSQFVGASIQTDESEVKSNPDDQILWKMLYPFKITFEWFTYYVFLGFKRDLQMQDLPTTSKYVKLENAEKSFDKWWGRLRTKKNGLFFTTQMVWGLRFWFAGLIQMLSSVFSVAGPYFVAKFLSLLLPSFNLAMSDDMYRARRILPESLRPTMAQINGTFRTKSEEWQIWLWVSAIISARMLGGLCNEWTAYLMTKVGSQTRAVVSAKIYQKSLRLSSAGRAKFSNGMIMNLLAGDMTRLQMVHIFFHMGFVGVFTIFLCVVLLFLLQGWTMFVGQVVFLVVALLMIVSGFVRFNVKKKSVLFTDKRVKLITQILASIKVIKFFAWENAYFSIISKIRKQEIKFINIAQIVYSFSFSLMITLPFLAQCASVTALYLVTGQLDPVVVFASFGYVTLLRTPLNILPRVFAQTSDYLISLTRVENFLNAEELEAVPEEVVEGKDYPIILENANLCWEGAKTLNFNRKSERKMEKINLGKLENVNLRVKRGALVAIIGKVGSGKSSLMSALLGEMKLISGKMCVTGSKSLVEQIAWILSSTVEENITFGADLDENKFRDVCRVCALEKDLEMLEGGRHTELGERGVNLSGGQKTRVAMARAVYQDSDILFFDDPLAAVDSNVGAHIMEECLVKYTKGRTRIFITHQLQYLQSVDHIVMIDKGKIVEQGSFNDLMSRDGPVNQLVSKYVVKEKENVQEDEKKKVTLEKDANPQENPQGSKLIAMEERKKGGVSVKTFISFLRTMGKGRTFIPAIVLSVIYLIVEIAIFGNLWWMGEWTGKTWIQQTGVGTYTNFSFFPNSSEIYYLNDSSCCGNSCTCVYDEYVEILWNREFTNGTVIKSGLTHIQSVYIYIAIAVLSWLGTWGRDTLLKVLSLRSAQKIHNESLKSLLRAPMSFFESQPQGRIVQRMSNDVNYLDTQLIEMLSSSLPLTLAVLFAFLLLCYSTRGIFVVFSPLIFAVYIGFYILFKKSTVSLKRLDSLARSPVHSLVCETLSGAVSLRAFVGATDRFSKQFKFAVNKHNRAFMMLMTAQRWMTVRFMFLGIMGLLLVVVVCVPIFFYTGWGILSVGIIGLAMHQGSMIADLMSIWIMTMTHSVIALNSVERLKYYAENLPSEITSDPIIPPLNWPNRGEIVFENVSLRYTKAEDESGENELVQLPPLVLQDLNFKIASRERIGVCGRTGAGKTSLIVALFRLTELADGVINIDEVDISKLELSVLRKRISIIPQEAVLFEGTVRSNLDPFNTHSDSDIWDALEKSVMRGKIEKMGGLDSAVVDAGENFSVGERQLLSFARAILTNCKILILDECTASVDMKTDNLIQETVRKEFKNVTIITIAHRLSTIIDYDRILVMDAGKVVEFDTPLNLLTMDKYHVFRELVAETGKANAKRLFMLAGGENSEISLSFDEEDEAFFTCSIEGQLQKVKFERDVLSFGGEDIHYDDITQLKKNDGDEFVQFTIRFESGDFEADFDSKENSVIIGFPIDSERIEDFEKTIVRKLNVYHQ